MTRKRPSKTDSVPEVLTNRLNTYALAATAAGVGVLALANPAEAKIIYTPTNQTILPRSTFNLDLNNDGVTDFTLKNFYYICVPSCSGGAAPRRMHNHPPSFAQSLYFGTLTVQPAQGPNQVAGTGGRYVAAIRPARPVGPADPFEAGGVMAFFGRGSAHSSAGNWRDVHGLYLGLKFVIGTETHYGWARFNVTNGGQSGAAITATLTGYAYESVANRPILTGKTHGPTGPEPLAMNPTPPQPATLGVLARGAMGLTAWRREEEEYSASA